MDMQKVMQCQKYYVFKIRDIVNNSFHTLEEKRIDSGVQHLDNGKIATGRIKPVFFCQILQIICCICCNCVL